MPAQQMKGRRVVRSARGKLVDFDLLAMKQKMASNPKPVEVQKREDFIDQKHRRKGRGSRVEDLLAAQAAKKAAEAALVPLVPPVEEFKEEDALVENTTPAPKIKLVNKPKT